MPKSTEHWLELLYNQAIIDYALMLADHALSDVNIDPSTNAQTVIDYAHHEIHDGEFFHIVYEGQTTNTGEMIAIAFYTPNTTKWLHLTARISVGSLTRAVLLESPSIDLDEGTNLAVWNRNRMKKATLSGVLNLNTVQTANMATSYTATQAVGANITISAATIMDSFTLGAPGANPARSGIGGTTREEQEWVLEQGQQYALVGIAGTNDDNAMTLVMNFYEHTDKA